MRSKWVVRGAWAVTSLIVVLMLWSASIKLMGTQPVSDLLVEKYGYPRHLLVGLGVLELFCVVVYAIPRTAPLGAVLLTGYLGAAIAVHVRVGDSFLTPLVIAGFMWLGVLARDDRAQQLFGAKRRADA